jgi:hypothetical protein
MVNTEPTPEAAAVHIAAVTASCLDATGTMLGLLSPKMLATATMITAAMTKRLTRDKKMHTYRNPLEFEMNV